MQLPNLNNHANAVARFGAVMLFITSFILVVTGFSARGIHEEIKVLELFMKNSEGVQSNFESSLKIYTENTEDAISFVHQLRPDDELEYIEFISQLESLGQSLGLNLELSSNATASGVDATGSNSLVYDVQFYGSYDQLMEFMKGLERMPYYMRVDSFDYAKLSTQTGDELERPNVSLSLRLYVE